MTKVKLSDMRYFTRNRTDSICWVAASGEPGDLRFFMPDDTPTMNLAQASCYSTEAGAFLACVMHAARTGKYCRPLQIRRAVQVTTGAELL